MGGGDSKAIAQGVQQDDNGMGGGDALDLSHQQWSRFPEGLKERTEKFVALQFFNNRISSFDNLIGPRDKLVSPCLQNCLELNVAGNLLTELPEQLKLMSALTSLDAGYNKIGKVDAEIFRLPKLRILILRNNDLEDLSNVTASGTKQSASHLPINRKLEELDLTGNKLKVPTHRLEDRS